MEAQEKEKRKGFCVYGEIMRKGHRNQALKLNKFLRNYIFNEKGRFKRVWDTR